MMTVIGSAISWTNSTWNWAVGCTKVSAGCDNCYASALVGNTRYKFGHAFEDVRIHEHRLADARRFRPIRSGDGEKLPHLVFTNSMSDAWHEKIPTEFIHKVLDVMEATPLTQYQILTKRPVRARQILVDRYGNKGIPANFWIGVSCEDNRVAARLNILRSIKERTGGTMTAFVSVEPIVGPTDALDFAGVDWAITGGESGGGARRMEYGWLTPAIENAKKAGAAVYHKQHGTPWSNPMLHLAPPGGIRARFQWLVDQGLELLPEEKGGATLPGKITWREFPAQYHRAKAALNAKKAELF
jgi:protein gp37